MITSAYCYMYMTCIYLKLSLKHTFQGHSIFLTFLKSNNTECITKGLLAWRTRKAEVSAVQQNQKPAALFLCLCRAFCEPLLLEGCHTRVHLSPSLDILPSAAPYISQIKHTPRVLGDQCRSTFTLSIVQTMRC